MQMPIASVALYPDGLQGWLVKEILKQLPEGSRYVRFFAGRYLFHVPGYPESNVGCPACAKTRVRASFVDGVLKVELPPPPIPAKPAHA